MYIGVIGGGENNGYIDSKVECAGTVFRLTRLYNIHF